MNCPVICQSVQSQMANFSAGQLSPVEATTFEQHCASCAICQREWATFQDTLLLLSGGCQPLPCEEASEEMWEACAADWMLRVEMRRSKVPLWGAIRGWAREQPRWGWVAISGAVTIFIGVWMMSPSNVPSESVNFAAVTSEMPADGGPLRIFNSSGSAAMQSGSVQSDIMQGGMDNFSSVGSRRVEFRVPPAMASSAVNYHAATSFDLFVDHVGSGLVSSSAQPLASPLVMQPATVQAPGALPASISLPSSPTFEASINAPR